jgi:hypothetical protein
LLRHASKIGFVLAKTREHETRIYAISGTGKRLKLNILFIFLVQQFAQYCALCNRCSSNA